MKHIKTAYSTLYGNYSDDEDIADYDETGWYDEEGYDCEPTSDDIYTAVGLAVCYILSNGSVEPSGSMFYPGVWYTTIDLDRDMRTGDETWYSYHLYEFTEEEQHEIYNRVTKR